MDSSQKLQDFISDYYPIIAVVVILLVLFYVEAFSKLGLFMPSTRTVVRYGYEEDNGPATWGRRYPCACGCRQSPINIDTCMVMVVPSETACPLKFSCEYFNPPCEMKLYNSGYNVVLYAQWGASCRPTICGGPLPESYHFINLRFRWGQNLEEGSEHMIDSMRYAMEVQVMYVKSSCCFDDIIEAARCEALLIISYVYLATPIDNPYIEPFAASLTRIQCPLTCLAIDPVPLTLIAPNFCRNYYTYMGSLTFPPCTEGVRWIVQPEPLAISPRQVRKFRKLIGLQGPILTNTRPVQKLNKRDVCYYD